MRTDSGSNISLPLRTRTDANLIGQIHGLRRTQNFGIRTSLLLDVCSMIARCLLNVCSMFARSCKRGIWHDVSSVCRLFVLWLNRTSEGSATVLLNRVMTSSYKLSKVTMFRSAAVGLQIWMQHCCLQNYQAMVHCHCRSFVSNLEQVANLLCVQTNLASYPQCDGKWVVAYGLRGKT